MLGRRLPQTEQTGHTGHTDISYVVRGREPHSARVPIKHRHRAATRPYRVNRPQASSR